MEPQCSVYSISLTFSKYRHMPCPQNGVACLQWLNMPYMGTSATLTLWEHWIWKEHPCTVRGHMRISAEPQFLWAGEGWEKALCFLWKLSGITLVAPLLFRLCLTRLPTAVRMAIRHQRCPFQSCPLRSWLLSNLRSVWVYSQ